MRLLLTNDDGYGAEGLLALADALGPGHDLWVVAPHENRSGVSHGISLTEELRYRPEGARLWSCTGKPADCTIAGTLGLMPEPPDAVVSGINRGPNLGTDIVYSGTAAAAREAAFSNIPGIAVSLVPADDGLWDYGVLARFVSENIETLVALAAPDVFVNVNAKSAARFRGARLTGVSRRIYRNGLHLREDDDGSVYGTFMGGRVNTLGDPDSDWHAVEDGFVSVSRIRAQPCAAEDGLSRLPVFRV